MASFKITTKYVIFGIVLCTITQEKQFDSISDVYGYKSKESKWYKKVSAAMI